MHKAGIVHCDIKPGNVMIDSNLKPVLIDYGLSHQYRDKSDEHIKDTKADGFKGTWAFCSLRTAHKQVQTRRDDLESLLYLVAYMLKVALPWIPHSTWKDKRKYIIREKLKATYQSVHDLLPKSL